VEKQKVIHGVPMKFPEWFYGATEREPRDLVAVKTRLCTRQLRFQRINASCVVVVVLIRRVCLYVSSPKWVIGI
jgi:hypothetical protein